MFAPRKRRRPLPESAASRHGPSGDSGRAYRRLFENCPVPMMVFDRETFAVLAVNAGAVKLYGYSRKAFLGLTVCDIRPPEEVPRFFEMMAIHGADDEYVSTGFRHRKRNGALIDVEVRSRAVQFGGRAARLAAVLDVTDRNRVAAEREVLADQERRHREQLEAVSRGLVEVQEAERREVARALHDEIGQLVTALQLQLEGAGGAARTDQLLQLVKDIQARVRTTSLNLRPPMLDELGLKPALLWHVERYVTQTGVRVGLTVDGLERRFPPQIETGAFRIMQEALTNVARHSRSGEVSVLVEADHAHLVVEVTDYGVGFAVAKVDPARSTGLAGIRERARLLGGEVAIVSAPDSGTHVTAWIPLGSGTRPAP